MRNRIEITKREKERGERTGESGARKIEKESDRSDRAVKITIKFATTVTRHRVRVVTRDVNICAKNSLRLSDCVVVKVVTVEFEEMAKLFRVHDISFLLTRKIAQSPLTRVDVSPSILYACVVYV